MIVVGLLWILGCQVVGELISRGLDLPIPGPVIGMMLLLIVLTVRQRAQHSNQAPYAAADALLAHLQLYFVPAGVGILVFAGLLGRYWWPVVVAMLGSYVVGLMLIGWMVQLWVAHAGGISTTPGEAEVGQS